ncbi:DUF6586 family protein [Marinobacterium arenosum]|uniref:DUF6586 family protein n=1 Tax=Marinobacterium arenosum TaxID=2862496 RepID=UPI001C93FE61|nr:DUF6586 family protein [Marinobacterium arenosum]MBY4676931.1 hypothetical protein [Marinobacterium arenosum]
MSSIYLARTNQKLNFARIHLDALREACDSTGWSKHALMESYNESVLFHLASGYAAFLREIAERYGFATDHISGYRALEADVEASGQECPELRELRVLEENQASWLHLMLQAYEACWRASDRAVSAEPAATSASEIHVVQVNPSYNDEQAIVQEYQSWLNELRELVDRLRAGMQEW